MKIRISALAVSLTLVCSTHAADETNFNSLIKTQQDIDKNTRQETRIEKKDVYSSVDNSQFSGINLPVEENCLVIDNVVFENDFLNDATLKKIRQQLAGRCMGAKGIDRLAGEIQDYYINSGYVTTRVVIPAQDLTTKRLILSVAPGRIEKIIIEDDYVRTWSLPFKPEDVINLRDIEQGLEVLQRIPGLNVKINIEPGSKNGYSNVVITTGRSRAWNLRTWVNNWGNKITGRTLMGAAGYLYNLAKMSDIFYLSGTRNVGKADGGYKSVSAYYSVPFGYWDYEVFFADSRSHQPIGDKALRLQYAGQNQYLSLKGTRMIYRDQQRKLLLSGELTRRKVNYYLNDTELALQKRDLTNARIGVNYKQNFNNALLDTTLSYQRFLPFLGGEKTADMRSEDVSAKSHIFNLDVNYTKLLNTQPFDSYYQLAVGAQYTPGALTLQDQYTLGSRWNVRGFENTSGLYGNKGFYIRNTFNVITGFKNLEWYLGADYGQIWGDIYPQGLYNDKKLLGTVTGIKGSFGGLGYDASISAPVIYPDAMNADKLNVNFTFSYQL